MTAASSNPLRKQTLLGIAPTSAAPSDASTVSSSPASGDDSAPAALPPSDAAPPNVAADGAAGSPLDAAAPAFASPPAIASDAAAPSKTDAPTTRDVARAPITQSAQSTPVATSSDDPLPELRRPRARWLAVLGVAAALALGVVGLRSLDRAPTPPRAAERPAVVESIQVSASEPAATRTPDAPAAQAVIAPSAAPPADDAQQPAPSAPAEATSAAPAASAAAAATSGGKVRINVDSAPQGARLFWKGKEVGTTPFVLELVPGERHAYELGLPGHITRKVVIDGTQSEIKIGLRPDPKAPPGITSRK